MTVPQTSLYSNGIAIPFDASHFAPLRDSTEVVDDAGALQARYQEDGYLYLRGVLDRPTVIEMRAAYFAAFDPSYLRPGTTLADGVFSGRRDPKLPAHGVTGHPAHAFVRTSRFQAFADDPRLADLASRILGAPVLRLPRAIIRHFDRSTPLASRAHVDYSYLDAGSDQLLTVWVPLGDCPRPTGGLVYLEGTHRRDRASFDFLRKVTDRPHDARAISHDLAWVSEQLGRRWRWADYQAGDVAIHSPHIVHASLDTTADHMRLSADLRFLRRGEAADVRWLHAWAGDDGN
jgi:ectoine hydroxylase-related dioxygenase (phytanoyl-CoA dioxygenase family)